MNNTFGHLDLLWLLLLVPLLYAFYRRRDRARSQALERFAKREVLGRLLATVDFSRRRKKRALLLGGVALLAVSLAQPRFGSTTEPAKRLGVDIIVALDVSTSMLAEDVKPSRLDRAKLEVRSLLERIAEEGGDRIGLLAFAGDAFLVSPLSIDYGAARIFLKDIGPETIGRKGTAIARAIEVATKSFPSEEQKYKALILVTDGEDHEGAVLDAADRAAEQGVRIYTVGLGDPRGQPIPVYDEAGRRMDYKTDPRGHKVNSRLDEATLRNVAARTEGTYLGAVSGNLRLEQIYDEVKTLEEREYESRLVIHYEERFQPFVGLALLCLLLETILSDRARRQPAWQGRFET